MLLNNLSAFLPISQAMLLILDQWCNCLCERRYISNWNELSVDAGFNHLPTTSNISCDQGLAAGPQHDDMAPGGVGGFHCGECG